MSKFKVINLIDKVFISSSIFLVIYAWINFFIRDLWTTFILSLIFSFACVFLLFFIINKRNEKKSHTKEYYKDVEEKFLCFNLMSKSEKLDLLKSIISSGCECKKLTDSLLTTHGSKTTQIFIATNLGKLTQNHLINIISNRRQNVDIVKIVCEEFDQNLNTKILTNLEIEIINKKKLYDEYFLAKNTFPNCANLNRKNDRKKLKDVLKNFIVPQKAKSYFCCGLILIFSSIILPYHNYYLIFGSSLLILSIICKLQPIFKR